MDVWWRFMSLALLTIFVYMTSVYSASSPTENDIKLLKEKLKGDIYMPNSDGYKKRTTLLNTRFSGKPRFIVLAKDTADVQHSVIFAKRFKLGVSVLSSGHDYIGRSIADNTVHISLKLMRAFTVNTTDSTSDTGLSATVQPGENWRRIYKMLHKYGYLAVGASGTTVATGGYFLGGGHSPITPSLGLGVDGIIEFEMVTANGDIVKVKNTSIKITSPGGKTREEKDKDLFWGVRGGGPGSYGVVTSYKIKLHRPPKNFTSMSCSTYIKMAMPSADKMGEKMLKLYNKFVLDKRSSKIGGYLTITNQKGIDPTYGVGYQGTITMDFLYFGGWAEAVKEAGHLYHEIVEEQQIGHCTPANHSSFWDYQKHTKDHTGFSAYLISRFLHKKDFNNNLIKLFTRTLLQQNVTIYCTGVLLGGKAANIPVSSSSVSRHFRQSHMSMACADIWNTPGENMKMVKSLRDKFGKEFYKFGQGVHLNEPDYYLTNWKEEYWGGNYAKLLKIKKKWDPNGMFWCHHCVGSDGLSSSNLTTRIGDETSSAVFLEELTIPRSFTEQSPPEHTSSAIRAYSETFIFSILILFFS